jgi:ketosteroid isomerase-like protein
MIMEEQDLTQRVTQGYEKFKAGDIAGLMEGFADDIEWVMPDMSGVPFAKTWHGKQGFAEFAKSFNDSLRTSQFEPREIMVQGDKVAVLGFFAGEAKPTGHPVETEWVHLYTYKDGKLKRFQQFSDTAAMEAAFSPGLPIARDSSATLHQ